jgi:outer membrane protein TolC
VKTSCTRFLGGLLLAVCSCSALAGTSPALAAALEAAWQRALAASEASGRSRIAEARLAAASSPWAAPPSVDVSQRENRLLRDTGQRETEVGVSWPLWLPGQRDARQNAARGEIELAGATAAQARLALAGELRELVWAAAALQAVRADSQLQADSLDRLTADVARRVDAGELAHADLLAARADAELARAAVIEAAQQLRAVESRWQVLTGGLPLPNDAEERSEGAPDIDRHPDLLAAQAGLDLARRRSDAVRLDRRDPPELLVRYRHDEPGAGVPAQDSIGLGLRIPLGTADRNLERDAGAAAEVERAQVQRDRTRERLSADVALAEQALTTASAALDAARLRAALLAERTALLERAFRAGESGLPELLRVRAAAAQAQQGVLRQQAALGHARARLHQTIGLLP